MTKYVTEDIEINSDDYSDDSEENSVEDSN